MTSYGNLNWYSAIVLAEYQDFVSQIFGGSEYDIQKYEMFNILTLMKGTQTQIIMTFLCLFLSFPSPLRQAIETRIPLPQGRGPQTQQQNLEI